MVADVVLGIIKHPYRQICLSFSLPAENITWPANGCKVRCWTLNHRSSSLSFAMDHSHPASPPPTPAKKARVDLLDPTYEPEQVGSASTSEMASQPPVVTSETSATTSGPRKIDENTDMTTLTDQEIMRLMEGMDHTEDVMTRVRPRHLSVARLTPSSH